MDTPDGVTAGSIRAIEHPDVVSAGGYHYDPQKDWINQSELAALLHVTAETACRWARQGRLRIFEHRMIGAAVRKYSRQLVQEYQQMRMDQARERMRSELGK